MTDVHVHAVVRAGGWADGVYVSWGGCVWGGGGTTFAGGQPQAHQLVDSTVLSTVLGCAAKPSVRTQLSIRVVLW